jgi:hypothetical protein
MLVACRLAGLSALERYYAGVGVDANAGAWAQVALDKTLAPVEYEIVALINLPSASSRDRREACMACIVEAPIR